MFKRFLQKRRRPAESEDGYITIIYPRRGCSVVIHDSLNKGTSHSAPPNPVVEFEDEADIDIVTNDRGHCSAAPPMFNPANGLLMLNDFFDIEGNPYGFDDL